MTFREAETLPVRARDAVMQIYAAAYDGGSPNLSSRRLRTCIEAVYEREDLEFYPIKRDILGSIRIFRRLGFAKEVMLDALAELETEGAIPNEEAIRARLEREAAQAMEILSGHKKPIR